MLPFIAQATQPVYDTWSPAAVGWLIGIVASLLIPAVIALIFAYKALVEAQNARKETAEVKGRTDAQDLSITRIADTSRQTQSRQVELARAMDASKEPKP